MLRSSKGDRQQINEKNILLLHIVLRHMTDLPLRSLCISSHSKEIPLQYFGLMQNTFSALWKSPCHQTYS